MVTPPPAPKPKSGGGWKVFAIILLVFLMISVFYNIGSFFSGLLEVSDGAAMHGAGPRLTEVVREDNDAADKIAIIDVSGVIMSGATDSGSFDMVDIIRAQLKRAGKDNRVKAVILKVDSPGGEVLASDEIYRAILDFQTQDLETGGGLHGQRGRLRRVLCLGAVPVDRGERTHHHGQHRRNHEQPTTIAA